MSDKKSLIVVMTGDGKGKTTSAVGQIVRAYGNGLKPLFLQFLKKDISGEVKTLLEKGIAEHHIFGNGFTWLSEDLDVDAKKTQLGWEESKKMLLSQKYDLVVLDEFTYAMNYNMVDTDDVCSFFKQYRDILPHIFITGRDASDELCAIADTVSVIMNKKHHYDSNIASKVGIES